MLLQVSAEFPGIPARPQALVIDRDEVLEPLYRARYSELVGLARLLLDDRAQAEDGPRGIRCTYAAWDRVRDQADPLPYLRRAVVNLARGGLRRRIILRRQPADRPVTSPSAEVGALAAGDFSALAKAVRSLPERQRQCVVLRYFLDCSTSETASTLGISGGAVKTHLHRTLATLARDLESLR